MFLLHQSNIFSKVILNIYISSHLSAININLILCNEAFLAKQKSTDDYRYNKLIIVLIQTIATNDNQSHVIIKFA